MIPNHKAKAIEIELNRAQEFVSMLQPSPNYDECELRILRTCLANIRKIIS